MQKVQEEGLVKNRPSYCIGPGSPCGLDLKVFDKNLRNTNIGPEFRKKLGIPQDAYVVGFAGRPVARKGFDDSIRAWIEADLPKDSCFLLLAGGNEKDARRVTSNLPSNIIPCSFMLDPRPFYLACDVVMLPSYYEGFGAVLIEAAALGCALIGTDIPGIWDAIIKDQTGLLVEAGNRKQLALAIELLRNDPELRRKLAAAAQKRTELFESTIFFKNLIEIYAEILELNKSSAHGQAQDFKLAG